MYLVNQQNKTSWKSPIGSTQSWSVAKKTEATQHLWLWFWFPGPCGSNEWNTICALFCRNWSLSLLIEFYHHSIERHLCQYIFIFAKTVKERTGIHAWNKGVISSVYIYVGDICFDGLIIVLQCSIISMYWSVSLLIELYNHLCHSLRQFYVLIWFLACS